MGRVRGGGGTALNFNSMCQVNFANKYSSGVPPRSNAACCCCCVPDRRPRETRHPINRKKDVVLATNATPACVVEQTQRRRPFPASHSSYYNRSCTIQAQAQLVLLIATAPIPSIGCTSTNCSDIRQRTRATFVNWYHL